MKKKEKAAVLLMTACFFGWVFVCWGKQTEEYSITERRKLAQFPKISLETVQDGSFMTDFEEYALDQFPLRDHFRRVKSWISGTIFQKMDDHEIYVKDGYAVKMEYPLQEKSIENALKKFEALQENYLKGKSEEIYVAVIPDKNYFLGQESGHLTMDYERLFEQIQDGMPYAETIDLTGYLSIEDYYRTDIHWRQEALTDVAEHLADTMGINIRGEYEKKTLEHEFYGVYFGQSALDLPGEPLVYLTNEVLDQCTVYNYETGAYQKIYDLEKAGGKDPYEIYLSGPVSLLTIENTEADTEKELIVFRDSFGSSLVPLLVEGYRKITLIDIRYIQSSVLEKYVDFQGKQVLFLYSTSVFNHSETLK